MKALKRDWIRAACVWVLALSASATAAQVQGQPWFGGGSVDVNDTRVSLNVTNQPVQQVVDFIARRAKVNIIVSEGINETVTVELTDVPWRLALDVIAQKAKCAVEEKAANLLVLVQPQPVTFNFTGADVKTVIDTIAKVSGASIVTAPNVEGQVHLRITDVPWRTALDTVAKTLGFVVVEDGYNIYRVVHPSSLEAQMITRVFPVKYLRPSPPYRPKISSQHADSTRPATTSTDPEKDFPLLQALRGALSPKGKLDYFGRNNTLMVKDIPPVVAEIERMLAEVDVEPGQVFIDVKFVTTSNTDALTYGFDIGQDGFRVGLTGGAIPSRLPFNVGSGGWNNAIIPGDENPVRTPGLTTGELKDAITYGTLDFTGATFTLNLLQQDEGTRIVQAPKLLALDNQEATIFVGRTIRFAETQAQSNQSGGLTYSIKEASNSPVQTGFQLFMMPHIVPGTNKIMMTVIPEAEQLVGRSTDPNLAGFQVFRSGEGTENEVQIALPQVASSTLVTTLMLESGQTAVIGGLITESEAEVIRKLPVLGDIPLLGFFFKSVRKSKVNESLLIFITPRIIRDSSSFARFLSEEDRRRQEAIEAEMEEIFGEGDRRP